MADRADVFGCLLKNGPNLCRLESWICRLDQRSHSCNQRRCSTRARGLDVPRMLERAAEATPARAGRRWSARWISRGGRLSGAIDTGGAGAAHEAGRQARHATRRAGPRAANRLRVPPARAGSIRSCCKTPGSPRRARKVVVPAASEEGAPDWSWQSPRLRSVNRPAPPRSPSRGRGPRHCYLQPRRAPTHCSSQSLRHD